MRIYANDRTVDEGFLEITVSGQGGKDALPRPTLVPPGKPLDYWDWDSKTTSTQ